MREKRHNRKISRQSYFIRKEKVCLTGEIHENLFQLVKTELPDNFDNQTYDVNGSVLQSKYTRVLEITVFVR